MKTIREKAKAYDKVRKKIAIRFGSNVADEFFAEFEGSKDEEIRKALLEMVHDTTGDELWVDYNVHKEEALAWLEKQGQVKESTISQHENRTCEENGNSLTYEDERIRAEENKGNIGGISSNSEWSKEDEIRLNTIINDITVDKSMCKYEVAKSICDEQINWLKSLKDRVQPKQEWSEEDEQHIDSLLKRLDALCRNKFERTRFAISEDRDWLKSLRPQNRWKPSDEHISLLQAIINEPNNAASESCQIVLKDILEQLKKLKEGKV